MNELKKHLFWSIIAMLSATAASIGFFIRGWIPHGVVCALTALVFFINVVSIVKEMRRGGR